jgi:hypothetical protein
MEVGYLSHGSISATIFEYTFPTIYKMWPNKINTYQLKIPTKQLKANSTITSHTKQSVLPYTYNQVVTHLSQNVFYLIPVTKQLKANSAITSHTKQNVFYLIPVAMDLFK